MNTLVESTCDNVKFIVTSPSNFHGCNIYIYIYKLVHTHTHIYIYIYIQCITKVSTLLTFLQIFKYISSWDNTDKMTLSHNEK